MKCLLITGGGGGGNERVSEAYQQMEKGRDGSGSAWDVFVKA